jgi:RNA polymerase sigma-70 factor (ECF subfamily)
MTTDHERCILMEQARAGDRVAVNALLETCRPALIGFVNSRLPPYLRTQVAEEIVQEAYALAWTKLSGFEWRDYDAFVAWLKVFADNCRADWWKYVTRRKRDYRRVQSNQEGKDPEDAGPSLLERAARDDETPSHVARRHEREDALKAAMQSQLTDQERQALELRYFENLSVSTAAAVLECTPGTVKNLCLSGKKKLREALGRSSQFFSSR